MGEIPASEKFDRVLAQVEDLRRQMDQKQGHPEFSPEALEILSETIEELNVAQEELQARNTELLAMREILDQERQRYQDLFELAPDGYLVTDKNGVIREANQTAAQMLKVQKKYLVGKPLLIYIAREDRPLFDSEMRHIRKGVAHHNFEIYLQPRTGLSFPAWVNVGIFEDPAGRKTGQSWLIRDITARRRADTELKYASVRYRNLFEEAPILYVITSNRNGVPYIADCNQQFFKALGYSREEALGKPLADFYSPDSQTELLERGAYQRSLQSELLEGEREFVTRDGRVIPCLLWSRPEYDLLGNLTGTRAAYMDISAHKRAEAALRTSQANLKALIENADARIWAVDRHYCLMIANTFYLQKVELALGRKLEYGECVLDDRFPAEVLAEWRGYYDRALAGEVFNIEIGTRFNPAARLSEYRFYPIKTEDGQVIGAAIIERDITERKQAEESLRLFKRVIESSQEAISITDADGQFAYINPAHEKLFGRTLEEARRMNYRDFYPPESLKVIEEIVVPSLARGEGWEGELDVFDAHGRRFPLWERADTILDANGKFIFGFGVMHDVSERKQAEADAANTREKLRALSQYLQTAREEERTHIAREIHDEFGQALTALKMDLAWIEKQLTPEQAQLVRKVREMSGLVDGTIQTVRRVATELRPGVLDNLGLAAALEWQVEEFTARTGLQCAMDLPDEAGGLERDQMTVLFRAFQEALTNVARHAQATRILVKLAVLDDCVELLIEDNGKGIREDEIADPKSLGLIGIRERIQALGGSFEITGIPKKGTAFRIRMPRTNRQAS